MNVQLTTHALKEISCDALLIGATRQHNKATIELSGRAVELDTLLDGLIHESNQQGEFRGNAGELLTIHPQGRLAARRLVVVGLGARAKLDTQVVRQASAGAARHLQQTGACHITLAVDVDGLDALEVTQAQVEGALLGLYTFGIYQNSETEASEVTQITLATAATDHEQAYKNASQRGQILAEATNFARTLVNEPPNVLTPTELAQRASTMAARVGLASEIFEHDRISELGMGGLLAVTQGSAQPPRFIILRYHGAGDETPGIALVGKGITFDTGGISLKPADHMDEMKGDMGGAAAVLGAMQAIAQLKPAINVTALVPTCENMPSGSAYRPGDILHIYNGKTIEIVNTDAEGRLVLADALSYAVQAGLSPIIDLATLTGGIVVALGHSMTGLFSNNEQLTDQILAAGARAGEKFWPMPLDDDYNEYIKSDIADIKQTGGRWASSVTAAKILEHFVGDAQWAHLDIAGTSYVESKKPYQEKGGTGVGVRTLAALVLQLAQQHQAR